MGTRWGRVEGRRTRLRGFPPSSGHADSPAPVNGINGSGEDASQETVSKPSLRLGFAEYCRISNLIVLHLRKMEEGMYPTLLSCCQSYMLFLPLLMLSVVLSFRRDDRLCWLTLGGRLGQGQHSLPTSSWSEACRSFYNTERNTDVPVLMILKQNL